MKKIFSYIFIVLVLSLIFLSCSSEKRFKSDHTNRMTKRARIADDHLARQAVVITQENIDNKESNQKKSQKRQSLQQNNLNELNKHTSKAKKYKKKKFSGDFMFY
jgi:hypothetical protein